ncbi:MAG: cupin domain-containing protein [Lachnospiraceae bacterium]|nr:cupin domain-containing protein [Lachnospiraceae bacterium]
MAKVHLVHAGDNARTELHDALGLTGCEMSVNTMPADAETPFIHCHDQNEELYMVLSGSGRVWLDGDVTAIREGDCFKVEPPVRRCLKAGPEGLRYVCIQARAGSLAQYTMTDGKIVEGEKPRW